MLNLSIKNKPQNNLISKRSVVKEWKGVIPFAESLKAQEYFKSIALKGAFCFLGFESERPVITKGLRTKSEDIVWSEEVLNQKHFEQHELIRGGQATLHSPGQLVIYPVFSLSLLNLKMKDFIILLEDITRDVLNDLGIPSERLEEYAGLSTERGKIAFFGIHISGGVSQHGLSININNDLSLFSSIKSCGVLNRSHDRLADHDLKITSEQLFNLWIEKSLMRFKLGYSSVG